MSASQVGNTPDLFQVYIDSNIDRWRALFQELIRVPSLFESEHAIVDLVARHIEQLGADVQKVAHDSQSLGSLAAAQHPISRVPGRNSLVVRLPGKGRGRSLVINTHLDVVPEGDPTTWTHPPFAGHIEDSNNIIYGRGAMDDKAGVTASLAVLETLLKAPVQLAGEVIFHYVLEDEITGNGTLLCLKAGHTADAALIMDGTRSDKAINQHAGNMQFEIKVKGKPASVSVSHMGINAAEMMARLLLHLRDAVFALNERRVAPWTRFPSPFQMVIQRVQSEGSQLTVPELAAAQCYTTFPPPFDLSTMRQFLQQQVERFADAYRLPELPELDWNGFMVEPVESDTQEIEQVLQQSATRSGMTAIDFGPSTGTSDLRHFAEAGIPCVLYGPGAGFNPHRADEHYHLDDLPRMILFYLHTVDAWCGSVAR